MTDRAEFIAGLRVLADLLEANDEMALPWHGCETHAITVYTDEGQSLAAYADAMTDKKVEIREHESPRYRLRLTGHIGGVSLLVYGDPADLPKTSKGTKVVEEFDYDTSALLGESVTV